MCPTTPDPAFGPEPFADSRFGAQAVVRLREAFRRSRHPMLIADDQRRWVTGNAAASELLGVERDEIPWRRWDDFTPPATLHGLEKRWAAFLAIGAGEGWYELYLPERGIVSVQFSATANVLPGRHLSVFIAPSEAEAAAPREADWTAVQANVTDSRLTSREREVMTLVASGLQSADIAERLVLSPETIKSHVRNALRKLGAHTRAHAVAIALVLGEITWEHVD